MDIKKTQNGNELLVALAGRLDTVTAPSLEAVMNEHTGKEALKLDFTDLAYISSAGLRVLLSLQKKANAAGGSMVVTGVCEDIQEVFDMTGFADILTIE